MLRILVVGSGLAGLCLSAALQRLGFPVTLMDAEATGTASGVAGGVLHPLVFKRLTLSHQAGQLFPAAVSFYSSLSKDLGSAFWEEKPLLRLLASDEERNLWRHKQNDPDLVDYCALESLPKLLDGFVAAPAGVGRVHAAGRLHIPALRKSWLEWLRLHNSYRMETFQASGLVVQPAGVSYKGEDFRLIVFCDGHQAIHNPWLPRLDFRNCKGEILTVAVEGLPEEYILNKDLYIIPLGNGIFKAGSTYQWQFRDGSPTPAGLQEIKDKLEQVLLTPFTILKHEAGIRPAIANRRVVAGFVRDSEIQSQFSPVAMLNGLGARGAMTAPFFALQLAGSICQALS